MSISLKEAKANADKMNKSVGQINPYPTISVLFKTLGRTAIQKTGRGILCIVITDATVNKPVWTTLKSSTDILKADWTEENAQLLLTAFSVFAPSQVLVRRQATAEDIAVILKEIESRNITHLACPYLDATNQKSVETWAKENEVKKGTVFVTTNLSNGTSLNSCALVEVANKIIKHATIQNYTPLMATVMIAGAMAGCPLNRSLDNIIYSDLLSVDYVEPVNGKFAFYNEDEKVRVVLAINTRTTFDSIWKPDTRYIKIFEGMNIVRFDIINTYKNYWLGNYMNDYSNKMQFVSLVNQTYFKELQPNVLSSDYDNRIDVDEESNARYIVTDGKDPTTMSSAQIRVYPTGGDVYLKGDVRFGNVMINLFLEILM